MNMQYSGILGFLILVGDIWAIINILGSREDNVKKLVWILLVVLLPVLGLVIWFLAGPKSSR